MSLSKLSKLPPEVLSSVLNNRAIPLRRRLGLRLLLNRWADIIEDGLKKETSLLVREAFTDLIDSQPTVKPDDLVVKGGILTMELIRTLVRLFPSPTELTLTFGKSRNPSVSWSTVPTLLAQLGTNLTSINLYGDIEQAVAEPLARALVALSNLTSLTLSDYDFSMRLVPHLGPVISRLEAFACPNPIGPVFASPISSSLSPRCTRLRLNQEVFETFSGQLLAQLSASLTYLHLVSCDSPKVTRLLSRMHGLTSLALGFSYMKVSVLDSYLFRHIVPFARLTELKLFGLVYDAPLALPAKKKMKTPWAAIQRLTLEVDFDDDQGTPIPVDYQAFFKSISGWFPVLAQLTLITSEDTFPDIGASLGKQSFSVETVDIRHFNAWAPDW